VLVSVEVSWTFWLIVKELDSLKTRLVLSRVKSAATVLTSRHRASSIFFICSPPVYPGMGLMNFFHQNTDSLCL